MVFTQAQLEELALLARFDLDTEQQGIKIHRDASAAVIEAARRLHAKGMLTLPDGGYLTPLGHETSEHVQALLSLLGGSGD
jgi:TIGR02647 family protein